jgi:UDP-glucose 4-epimerase
MKLKKIAVTGGAGFIGSNLVQSLSKDNTDIVVIDDLSTGRKDNIDELIDSHKIEFIKGSINDFKLLQDAFKNIDYVFHEAALPSVPRSMKDPLQTNLVNIDGTLNVLVSAKEAGVKKVVYASSSSVYGDTPTLPKTESMNPNPLSPYAVSKLTGEYYCQVFTTAFNLPTVALRYFNVFGPRQDPSSEYAAVIPRFIRRISDNSSPIIYGDGEQTRDFTYVNDIVQANICAAESNATGIYNIAGGKRITINDLAYSILKILDKKLKLEYTPIRSGDIKHSLADISSAKNVLGYKPKYDIKKGLEETVAWFQKQN